MDEMNDAVEALGLAAQQAALLRGALTSGFLARCAGEISVEELARATRLSPGRVRDLCVALRAAGVLESDNPDRYRISVTYAPLLRDGADVQIANQLAGTAVRERLIEQAFGPDGPERYQDLPDADRLALAAGVTVAPATELARTLARALPDRHPDLAARLEQGVRCLELGCGLAGATLAEMRVYPRMTAVGVDLAGDLIDRARAEAVRLGVSDRIRFVVEDAATYSDPEPFDVVVWSQFFFPAATRVKTLANAYDRLRPGGLLIAPNLFPAEPDPSDPATSLDVVLYQSWDVPVLTPDEMCTELTTAGFESPEVRPGPFAASVIARRPL
ncbi:SAM-dependent methyltransferase [Actinoplanes sp. NPDC049265]|uniref:SAM-dependent methyltransferase n=1 Tax=Actinoplanes sp. NPDC049265 TaxID=3363902 RepID=UPI0037150732